MELRSAVADTSLSQDQRKQAASHLIKLLAADVPVPDADDPEVISAMKPWPRTTPLEIGWVTAVKEVMRENNLANPTDGFNIEAARAYKHRYRKLARLKEIAADASEEQLVRDAASLELGTGTVRRA